MHLVSTSQVVGWMVVLAWSTGMTTTAFTVPSYPVESRVARFNDGTSFHERTMRFSSEKPDHADDAQDAFQKQERASHDEEFWVHDQDHHKESSSKVNETSVAGGRPPKLVPVMIMGLSLVGVGEKDPLDVLGENWTRYIGPLLEDVMEEMAYHDDEDNQDHDHPAKPRFIVQENMDMLKPPSNMSKALELVRDDSLSDEEKIDKLVPLLPALNETKLRQAWHAICQDNPQA